MNAEVIYENERQDILNCAVSINGNKVIRSLLLQTLGKTVCYCELTDRTVWSKELDNVGDDWKQGGVSFETLNFIEHHFTTKESRKLDSVNEFCEEN